MKLCLGASLLLEEASVPAVVRLDPADLIDYLLSLEMGLWVTPEQEVDCYFARLVSYRPAPDRSYMFAVASPASSHREKPCALADYPFHSFFDQGPGADLLVVLLPPFLQMGNLVHLEAVDDDYSCGRATSPNSHPRVLNRRRYSRCRGGDPTVATNDFEFPTSSDQL